LGERLRCSKERATVNNHSVMRALVVDAIADLATLRRAETRHAAAVA
jgi:hypothetical protein